MVVIGLNGSKMTAYTQVPLRHRLDYLIGVSLLKRLKLIIAYASNTTFIRHTFHSLRG